LLCSRFHSSFLTYIAGFAPPTHLSQSPELLDYIRSSVATSTLKTYDDLWKEWEHYQEPRGGGPEELFLMGEPEESALKIALFLRHLRIGLGKSHDRACEYLTAIRFRLEVLGINTEFFDHSTCRRARRASSRGLSAISRRVRASGGARATPFQLQWILQKDPRIREGASRDVPTPWLMTFTAVFLAFHLMLRVSEYTVKTRPSAMDHALRRRDIIFGDDQGYPMGSESGHNSVDRVKITIRSTKSTKKGIYFVHELRKQDSDEVRRLVEALWIWYHSPHTYHLPEDELFFAFQNNLHTPAIRRLNSRMVGKLIKDIAESNGQPRDLYSTHSLRVGGSEAMRLAGHDLELINRAGRWAPGSTAAVTYRTPAVSRIGAMNQVTNAIPDRTTDLQEVQRTPWETQSDSEESIGLSRPSRR